jgi:hypothetical protein
MHVQRDATRCGLCRRCGRGEVSLRGRAIFVDDVDVAAGALGVDEIDDMPWGRDFEITDPDGNRLRIGTPRHSS